MRLSFWLISLRLLKTWKMFAYMDGFWTEVIGELDEEG